MFEKITNFIITGEDKQDAIKEYENYIKNNKISECKIPQILYMSEIDNKIKDSKLMLFYKEQVMNKDKEDIEKIQKNPSFVNKILSLFKSNKKSSTMNIQQELIKVAKDLQAGARSLLTIADAHFFNLEKLEKFSKTPEGKKYVFDGDLVSSFETDKFCKAFIDWNPQYNQERKEEFKKIRDLMHGKKSSEDKLSDRACEIYGKINALGSQNAIPYFSKTREADKFQAKEYASDVEQQFKKVEQQVKRNEHAAELFQTAFEGGRRNAKDSIYLKNILHMYKWLSLI